MTEQLQSPENNLNDFKPIKLGSNVNFMKTPLKLPFKDLTNSADKDNKEAQESHCSKPSIPDFEGFFDDLDDFHCSKNQACFCSGENRKLDGEIIFEKLVSSEFLDLLDSTLRIPEYSDEDQSMLINISSEEIHDLTSKIYDDDDDDFKEISIDVSVDSQHLLDDLPPFDIEFIPNNA